MNTTLEDTRFELEKYRRVLENQHITLEENREGEITRKIDLNYLFSEKFGLKIAEYLEYSDIISLTYVNKFINKAIQNKSGFTLLIAKGLKKKLLFDQRDLKKRLSNIFFLTLIR